MVNCDKPSMRHSLKLVASDVVPHRALILSGALAPLLEVAFRVLEPWPLEIVADAVTAFRGTKVFHQPANVELLIGRGVALLLVVGSRALSSYLITIYFTLVGSQTATSLRARVFRRVQGLSQQFHTRNHSADTAQRAIGDVTRMQEVVITAGSPLMASVATLLVMAVMMFVLDPLLVSVVLVAIVTFMVIPDLTSRKIATASRQTREGEGQLANTAQESPAPICMVQAYGLENLVGENFTPADHTSLREGVRPRRCAARLERITDVTVGLATAIMLVDGGLRVMQGAMNLGDLVLFITYLRTTMKPLHDMAKYTGRIARASTSGERVVDLMEITPDVITPDKPVWPDVVMGVVRFDRVVTEHSGVGALHGPCLDVWPDERAAIIGPSRAGKPTLVLLLVRAIDPVSGCVWFDGHRLVGLGLTQLRVSVSPLYQGTALFTGTTRESIRMGCGDAADAGVEDTARAANAHDFITGQPDGYDTVVGERGGTLSGGQRQRIAIVRALLRYSSVVVPDEATTGLDPEATSLMPDVIDRLAADRTTLAVTHDAEVTLRATRAAWIEDSRIRLDATPEELVATSDMFRAWVQASGRDMDLIRVGDSR